MVNIGALTIGGVEFQNYVMEWSKQSRKLLLAIVISVIFIWSIFTEKMHPIFRKQLSSTVGRMLLIFLLYIVEHLLGWIPALLFTIGIAMTWANKPIANPNEVKEGFQDNIKVTKVNPHKWFIEKVLHENPKQIIQDRITTAPVQEDNSTRSSRSSHSSR